jgi:hypothetical protein
MLLWCGRKIRDCGTPGNMEATPVQEKGPGGIRAFIFRRTVPLNHHLSGEQVYFAEPALRLS